MLPSPQSISKRLALPEDVIVSVTAKVAAPAVVFAVKSTSVTAVSLMMFNPSSFRSSILLTRLDEDVRVLSAPSVRELSVGVPSVSVPPCP